MGKSNRGQRVAGLMAGRKLVAGSALAGAAWWNIGTDKPWNPDKLPKAYDVPQIRDYWDERPRHALRRLADIGREGLPFIGGLLSDYMLPAYKVDIGLRAQELRLLLTRLGPTFIKFGQMLGTRPDLLPPEMVYELQKLCDDVPHFDHALAMQTIQDELGALPETLFDELVDAEVPIAAASLGQVYKARLKSTGEWVAVKVQRPDMIEFVSLDLYLLRTYMRAVESVKSGLMSAGVLAARTQFDVALLDSFARASYFELDYEHEGRNQDRMTVELAEAMGPAGMAQIRIPRVLWPVSSRKVLVTEWIAGEQLARSPPDVIAKLVGVGVGCFMSQLVDIGFFHSDPHPGNLLVDAEGRLCIIDFGLCAELAKPDTRGLVKVLVHLMEGDVDNLITDAQGLGFLPHDLEQNTRKELFKVLSSIFEEAQLHTARQKANQVAASPWAPARRMQQLKAVSRQLNQVFFDFPFCVPEYFALITRALIVLEGIALKANPDFDLFGAAYPEAAKRAVSVLGWKDIAKLTQATMTSPMRSYKSAST